ncbi:TetR/AcrR family transcriptional regulator [Pseudofrankia asymbiotica]|uniref:HTH tetR-type domain-containing protein n=1 Tax=Pseudofrankia asymbiotica TaxID=1834516 RepID=A0A1V2I0D8_9ACTN|nr:TetR/AcrR family transcriptional regulator [Pseudofrankia asymbiotica]ONH22683.1 hypothetical protein BL253_34980 [Pseudofrankia asymbiotica]
MPESNGNAARRNQVLDAALKVFAAYGYQRASVNDIAEKAGLRKPSLYHYMQSKEDLLEAIVTRSHKRLTDQLKELPAVDSAMLMLRQIVYTHVLFNLQYGDEVSVFQADFRMLSPERQVPIRKMLNEYDRSLQVLVEEAQRRNEVPADVDAKLSVLWIMGGANHVVRWYRPKLGSKPEDIAHQFADLSVAALRGCVSDVPVGSRAR